MPQRARLAVLMAGITSIYILGGIVGLLFPSVNPAVTPIWPPSGIAVAALLVLGLRAWPIATAGAFLTNLQNLHHPAAAAVIAIGNTLECVVAVGLTMRLTRGRVAFERGPDIFRFAFAAILAASMAAIVGTAALRYWSLAPSGETWLIWLTWWLGDATGIVLYAPLLVQLTIRQSERRAQRAELVAFAACLILVIYAVFGVPAKLQRELPLAVLLLPLMLWSAFRIDFRTTAALGVVMSSVAIYRTWRKDIPFPLGEPATALLLVQSVVAIATLLMLAVAAETRVRRWVESELRALNDTLDRRVRDRTAELTRVHNRLVEAQAVAQIGSWEWNVATNELWWSDEMCRIFGVSAAPSGYEPYLLHIHPDDRARTDAAVKDAISTGQPFTFEHRIVRPDGGQRVIYARGRVEFDEAGAPVRMLGTGYDITERLLAEQARAQLIEEQTKLREAEEANRAKDAFLATLSHELRTPLNAALGWTHILLKSMQAGDDNARLTKVIYRNLQLQSRIVSDIMDISRIAKGELPLERERVEMRLVFEAAVDMVREAASAKGVHIAIRTVGSPAVIGDSRRLEQVAWNLLSNAVKFTPERGSVTVSIVESGDTVECSVEDDGPGIAPAFLPHVFEQFRQADSSTTREHGGLGLGLAIAHEIITMHEGTIAATNRAAGGAVFVVRLPRYSSSGLADAPRVFSEPLQNQTKASLN